MRKPNLSVRVNLPSELRKKLHEHARANGLCINDEILNRIKDSIYRDMTPSGLSRVRCWINRRKSSDREMMNK